MKYTFGICYVVLKQIIIAHSSIFKPNYNIVGWHFQPSLVLKCLFRNVLICISPKESNQIKPGHMFKPLNRGVVGIFKIYQEGIWQLFIHSISDTEDSFCLLISLTKCWGKYHLGRYITKFAAVRGSDETTRQVSDRICQFKTEYWV